MYFSLSFSPALFWAPLNKPGLGTMNVRGLLSFGEATPRFVLFPSFFTFPVLSPHYSTGLPPILPPLITAVEDKRRGRGGGGISLSHSSLAFLPVTKTVTDPNQNLPFPPLPYPLSPCLACFFSCLSSGSAQFFQRLSRSPGNRDFWKSTKESTWLFFLDRSLPPMPQVIKFPIFFLLPFLGYVFPSDSC